MLGKRFASYLPRIAALALLPVCGLCSDTPVAGVAVTISNYPAGAKALVAILTLNGTQQAPQKFVDGLDGMGPQLAFTFPAGTRGLVTMELLAEDGNGCALMRAAQTVTLADDIRYDVAAPLTNSFPAPQITSLSRSGLANNQTATVTITGQNLYPCATVQFGTMSAAVTGYSPPTQITVTPKVQPATCGPVAVSVTNPDGKMATKAGLFTYLPAALKYSTAAPVAAKFAPGELLIADVNKDGIPDVAIAPGTAVSAKFTPQLYLGDGTGHFQPPLTVPSPSGLTVDNSYGLMIGDVNKDGLPDVVYATHTNIVLPPNKSDNLITALQQSGSVYQAGNPEGLSNALSSPAMADLNADGKLDIATYIPPALQTQAGAVGVLVGNGDGTFDVAGEANRKTAMTSASTTTPPILLADYNADGLPDLLVGISPSSAGGTEVAPGAGSNIFGMAGDTRACGSPATMTSFVTGDFNGDKLLDVSTGTHICLGNGSGAFVDTLLPKVMTPTAVAAADFDGDGLTDLVVGNPGSGVTIWLSAPNNMVSQGYTTTQTAAAAVIRVADLNHDGLLDLVVADTGASSFEVLTAVCN